MLVVRPCVVAAVNLVEVEIARKTPVNPGLFTRPTGRIRTFLNSRVESSRVKEALGLSRAGSRRVKEAFKSRGSG